MSAPRTLIAGIGNIFLGDDAFGVEVAQRLMRMPWPEGVVVRDFGIRGIDLTYALLEPWDRVILVDAMPHGAAPGALCVIEPLVNSGELEGLPAHELTPVRVLKAARDLGATLKNVILVGCEPESFGTEEEPQMELSASVAAAVNEAVVLIEGIVSGKREVVRA